MRIEPGTELLTFKGPVQPSTMKLREELETPVGDCGVLLRPSSTRLGFRVWFRYEKYREEFALDDVIIAIDETPVGTFVEIEGSERGVDACAAARSAAGPPTTCSTRIADCSSATARRAALPAGDMLFARG